MELPPLFSSVEDECRYWKERAKFYYKEWSDTKQEFDEFVEDSRQLEAEMEATVEQKENIIKDLRSKTILNEKESEIFRVKLDSVGVELKIAEKQLTATQTENDNLKKYLRQLEQQNDDLERGYRILTESIADVKTDLDKAYEKNALLEIEVDEKGMLQEKLQRLMDETRDLKQELHVKEKLPCVSRSPFTDVIRSDSTENAVETKFSGLNPPSTDISQRPLKLSNSSLNGNTLPASTRTTALNIVADMLRKLNTMESKLKDYREHTPGSKY